VVMRSTVPPRTAEDRFIPLLERAAHRQCGDGLFYYSNPEFLREGTSVKDFRAPPFTLIGAKPGDDASLLRELYLQIAAPFFVTSLCVAESVKYVSNLYHAVKLAFANEVGTILAANGIDAREVFDLFCRDRTLNISSAYLRPGFAFGGSCLPKDVRAFLANARDVQIDVPFLRAVLPSNSGIVERAYEMVSAHGRQTVALFGLAFKPGTDDLRESPFVLLAERLLGRGYDLKIFDRTIDMGRLIGSNRSYIEREIPHLGRLLVSTPAEALSASRLAVIGHITEPDLSAMRAALTNHTVIDLFGVSGLQSLPGIRYCGFCW
jgi:GDP-mannose 6-dehydrogenase